MDEHYDYSRHKHCIAFVLGYDSIYSEATSMDTKHGLRGVKKFNGVSLLYNTVNKTAMDRGYFPDRNTKIYKSYQEYLIYVHNIFYELINIYQRSQKPLYKATALDLVIWREVINLLQQIVSTYKRPGDVNTDYYFVFILPNCWDYKTRHEIIRNLFIKADLIQEDDGHGRLIFLTELELTFRSMQRIENRRDPALKMNIGDQFVLCMLDLDEEVLSVNLELVSTRYPSLTATDKYYVPQLLKAVHFMMPFETKDLTSSLIACLEKRCDTTFSSRTITNLLSQIDLVSGRKYKWNDETRFGKKSFYQPFDELRDLSDERYNFNLKEIDIIRSITLEDIFENWSNSFEKAMKDHMDVLLQGMSNIKDRSMRVYYNDRLQGIDSDFSMPRVILKWFISYKSKTVEDSYFHGYTLAKEEISDLIKAQIDKFIIYRDPIILPKETVTVQPQSSLKPISFVNIDMSFTQIKIVMTYFDENRQIQRRENIESNMQPLSSFMIQSKLDQRPVLHITKILKRQLENIFRSYLKMYSYSNRRNMTRELFINPASKLFNWVLQKDRFKSTFLGNYFKVKLSSNRPREIRKLFVSSRPNLLTQLMENIEMRDLFTTKDENCSADNELVTICHPGYIYFFLITYLYTLNKFLEEKLDDTFGKDWRGNNIWYGVSVDKNLLDNVFGSEKKLEKLFFVSGVLEKDNDLRKAKFCTHGKEILPAIQQKFDYLNFRMRSYFVVAQIFSDRVQLTLHQVVKFASPEEDAATIVIQDEIIHINNIYDNLCRQLWKSILTDFPIDYCATHKEHYNALDDFSSFKTYSINSQELRQCIVKLLQLQRESLNMDSKVKIKFGKCDCCIAISLRDIIELSLKPVMEDITTIIAASLTNKMLFGNFEVDYIFLLGDPCNLSYGSQIHAIYTIITQQAIDDGVYLKEKDLRSFVIRESLSQLIEAVTPSKPYMYDRFLIGTLCQVSHNTCSMLNFNDDLGSVSVSITNRYGELKKTEGDGHTGPIIIQKGKPIRTKGLILTCNVDSINKKIIDMIKLRHSNASLKENFKIYDVDLQFIYSSSFDLLVHSKTRLIVDYRYLYHKHYSEISLRAYGCEPVYNGYNYLKSERKLEPLTLAYI